MNQLAQSVALAAVIKEIIITETRFIQNFVSAAVLKASMHNFVHFFDTWAFVVPHSQMK